MLKSFTAEKVFMFVFYVSRERLLTHHSCTTCLHKMSLGWSSGDLCAVVLFARVAFANRVLIYINQTCMGDKTLDLPSILKLSTNRELQRAKTSLFSLTYDTRCLLFLRYPARPSAVLTDVRTVSKCELINVCSMSTALVLNCLCNIQYATREALPYHNRAFFSTRGGGEGG